jgi:hypothetical protein
VSWAVAAIRPRIGWVNTAGEATPIDEGAVPRTLDLKPAICMAQESEPSYSFVDQKVRPSDGSTEVSLKSPTRLSGPVAVPAFASTGASIVPVESVAIRSVTHIDQ